MAKVLVNESYLSGIGNAIRSKTGGSTTYKPSEMAQAIRNIDVGYPEPTGTVSIIQNGTTNVKDYASANVNVPNSYNASDEGKVVVEGELVAQTGTTKTANGTYDTTTNNEVVVNVAGARIYTDGTEQVSGRITDVSSFTKLYDTSVPFGNYGSRVNARLGITDESAHSALMVGGWDTSGACYYDHENQIGAYGGYDFGAGKHLNKAKFWIGRYSGQNQTIIGTVQYKNTSDEWVDITDLEVTTTLPYPTNIFEVTLDSSLTMYGLRWIHKKAPQKTSGNSLTFFGMTLYETYSIGTYSPTTRGLVRVPNNYDGFGALNTTSVPNGYVTADEGKVVNNGALVAQRSQTIRQNGTYDTTLISELVANISGGGGSTNILSGADAPTASVGEDGDVYFQLEAMLFADEGYIVDNTTQTLATHSTAFHKTNGEPAIAVHWKMGAYYGPILVSNTPTAVQHTLNDSRYVWSADIDGTTWYICGGNYWDSNPDSPSIPTYYDAGIVVNAENAEAAIRAILNRSNGFMSSGDRIAKAYCKVNGTWQDLIGTDIDDVDTGN